MIVQFKLDECSVKPAYLKTLYDTIEELNCRCNTYLEEIYNADKRKYSKTRVVEIYGWDTMVSWLILRMQRYNHLVKKFCDGKSVIDDSVAD